MIAKGTENRSVRKTKKRLKDGLLKLLREKNASQIKVKELCDLVDVNRGTFYYHYTDVFDMLRKVEEEFFDEFYQIINDMKFVDPPESYASKILTEVFYFLDKNAELCEVLLGSNGDLSFINRMKLLVSEKCSAIWESAGSLMSPDDYDLFNSFIINGYIGLLGTWLKSGRKQPPEEMADFVAKIIIPAAVSSLSLKNVGGSNKNT